MPALAAALLLVAAQQIEVRAVPELSLREAAELRVELRSLDARPHRVRLMGACATGARLAAGAPIDVPASGSLAVSRVVFRADAPWESRHELQLVAVEAASELALGTASVVLQVGASPAVLPRLRLALAVAGLLLIAAAVLKEALSRRRAGPAR